MRSSLKVFATSIFFILFLGELAGNAHAQTIPAPASPRDLLKALPLAPEGWRLVTSKAAHLSVNPPGSEAKREYAIYDPTQGQPTASAKPLRTVSISVYDTRGNENITAVYQETEPGKPSELTKAGEWFNVGSARAVRTERKGEVDHVEALVHQRFLVTFVVKDAPPNQEASNDITKAATLPPERVESWLSRVNLGVLAQAGSSAGTLEISKDYEFKIEKIDELNPQRNSAVVFYMGGTNLE